MMTGKKMGELLYRLASFSLLLAIASGIYAPEDIVPHVMVFIKLLAAIGLIGLLIYITGKDSE